MRLRVDTDEVAAVAARLDCVADALDEQARLIGDVDWWPAEAVTHVSAWHVTTGAASASLLSPGLTVYAAQLSATAAHLRVAVDLYSAADAAADAALSSARATATWLAGKVLAFVVLTPVGQALTVSFVAWTAAGVSIAQGLAFVWWGAHGKHAPNLVDEFFAGVNWQPLIRAGVDLAGQLPHGAVPPVLLPLLGQRGAEGTAALAYLLALHLGLLRPGVFTVAAHSTSYSRGSSERPTIGSLVAAIPPADNDGPQVAVTTYTNAAGDHIYEIAITGTSSSVLGTDGQPFDNQGNAGTYGNVNAESVAAALMAISAAGVPLGATVVLSGYSQGAMVAQAIAASGKYNVEFVTTIGTPSRPAGIADDVTVVEIEHGADPVVGLQGSRPGHDDGAIVVTADPEFDAASDHHQGPMGNHAQDAYRTSADALAASSDPAVQAAHAELAALFDGYEETSVQLITVERNDAPEPLPGSVPWAVEGVTDAAEAVWGTAQATAETGIEVGKGAVETATEVREGVVEATTEAAHEVVDTTAEFTHEVVDTTAEFTHEVIDTTAEFTHEVVDTTSEVADALAEAAAGAAETVADAPVSVDAP